MTSHWATNTSGELNGYPGLVHLGRQVMELLPASRTYVEPFAGLGRTVRYAKADRIILNDKSDFARQYLQEHYPHCTVTNEDFAACARRHDNPDTVMMFDPPYRTASYRDNSRAFADRTDREYYQDLLALCRTLKRCKWLVCADATRTGEQVWGACEYSSMDLYSQGKVIFGKRAHIKVYANYEMRAPQDTLEASQ